MSHSAKEFDQGVAGERQKSLRRAEEREVRALITRDFSASLMNDTKWAELADAVAGLPLTFYVKWVDVPQAKPVTVLRASAAGYFDSNPFGPFLMLSVEWLEIFAINSRYSGRVAPSLEDEPLNVVARRLDTMHIPYVRESERLRVTGHFR